MRPIHCCLLLAFTVLVGCAEEPPPAPPAGPAFDLGQLFDPPCTPEHFAHPVVGVRWKSGRIAPAVSQPPGLQMNVCVDVLAPKSCDDQAWTIDAVSVTTVDGPLRLEAPIVRDGTTLTWQLFWSAKSVCVAVPRSAFAATGTLTAEVRLEGAPAFEQSGTFQTELSPIGYEAVDLLADSDGQGVWVATPGLGLFREGPAGVERYMHDPWWPGVPLWPGDGPGSGQVTALSRGPDGGIFVGSLVHGVSRFDTASGEWSHFLPDPSSVSIGREPRFAYWLAMTPLGLAGDGRSGLWVGTGYGLWHLEPTGPVADGTWTRVSDGTAMTVERGPGDRLWVGYTLEVAQASAESNLAVLHGVPADGDVDHRWLDGPPGEAVLAIAPAGEGADVLVGTNDGLFRARIPKRWRTEPLSWQEVTLPLPDPETLAVAAIEPDGFGGWWIGAVGRCGHDHGGLVHLTPEGKSQAVLDADTFEYPPDVSTLAPLPDGRLVFGTYTADFEALRHQSGAAPHPCDGFPAQTHADVFVLDPADASITPLR